MKQASTSSRHIALHFAMYGATLLLLLLLGEGMARLAGYRGWTQAVVEIELAGNGRFFIPDTTYGYTVKPGRFQVTEKKQMTFTVTHDAAARRITALPDGAPDVVEKPEIWIFGCSFTHGWGVDDDQTWPWQVQAAFPGYRVVNFAVSGYGTLHAHMQLQAALQQAKPPALVLLAYAGFHDQRNTANRFWMKTLSTFHVLGEYGYPYARWREGKRVQDMKPIGYRGLPLMEVSALMHLLDERRNQLEDHRLDSHALSEQLVGEMADASRDAGAGFLLAGITQEPATRDMLARFAHLPTVDISVDLNDPALSFLPVDPHPNAAAHRRYAAEVEAALRALGY